MLAYVYGIQDYLFFVLNMAIVSAYVAAAFTLVFSDRLLRQLKAVFTPATRIAGATFFAFAAFTRGELAWHAVIQEPYLNLTNSSGVPVHVNVLHAFQAISVWVFIFLVGRDLATLKMKNNDNK